MRPLATVMTVCKLVDAPFFRKMVTGPVASVQVRVNGLETGRLPKAGSVNETFAAVTPATKVAAARKMEEKRILLVIGSLRILIST